MRSVKTLHQSTPYENPPSITVALYIAARPYNETSFCLFCFVSFCVCYGCGHVERTNECASLREP